MKKWIALAAAAFLIAAGVYVGSPYWAARNLRQAAMSGDADRLDSAVDFPSVRESLKSQMSAALIRKMNDDPEMKGNPFAGLGMMVVPAIVDRMVDTYVTPDGLAELVRGGKPGESVAQAADNGEADYEYHWVGADRFRVKLTKKTTGEQGPSLLFERKGFSSWKLIKLEIPENMYGEPQRTGA
jgi:hypothetical protein